MYHRHTTFVNYTSIRPKKGVVHLVAVVSSRLPYALLYENGLASLRLVCSAAVQLVERRSRSF